MATTMILIIFVCVTVGFALVNGEQAASLKGTALELLIQHVKKGDAGRFISIDSKIWNPFLQSQDGFVRKVTTIPFYDTLDNATVVHQMIEWNSYEQWHSIDEEERMEIVIEVGKEVGYDTNFTRFPDDDGVRVVQSTDTDNLSSLSGPKSQAIEVLHHQVKVGDAARFLELDKMMWTEYLRNQDGFQSKYCLLPYYDTLDNATTIYEIINWASFEQWKLINQNELTRMTIAFTKAMGYNTMIESLPDDNGLRMVQGSDYPTHRRPVLNGYDVVMYHLQWDAQHIKNKSDVLGSPRWQYVLQTSIGAYTFWFSSPETLDLFRNDPWKYAPAYGGHCSHHIATDEGLKKEDLDAGLGYGVVCINTENWAIVNGTLYLNSCGMYFDFIEQPIEDVIRGNKRWIEWYGSLHDGPFNDVCFQDGASGELQPAGCCPDWD